MSSIRRESFEGGTEIRSSRRRFMGVALLSFAGLSAGCFAIHRSTVNAMTASKAVSETSAQLLGEFKRISQLEQDKEKTPTVCFIGVSGEGAADVSDLARAELEDGGKNFRMLPKKVGLDALKKSKTRANDLFIPMRREKFVEALGEPIDYLIAGYIENAPAEEEGGAVKPASATKKVFRLTMVELSTNKKYEFAADL